MTIFLHKSKSNKHSSPIVKPKLFILGSKPGQSQTTEWIIELLIPASQSSPKTNVFSKATPSEITAEQQFFFSRLLPDTHTTTPPPSVELRIFLCSVTQSSPEQQLEQILKIVHLTPEPSAWLRQALFALQTGDIIPGISHGLDINKFMDFATSYSPESVEKTVNYSIIAKENERLRKMFSSPDTDYSVINDSQKRHVDDEEDHWNDHSATMKQEGKTWGGFWTTHGSGSPSSNHSRDSSHARTPFEQRNVYGGLM